jgi:hypothetical protein
MLNLVGPETTKLSVEPTIRSGHGIAQLQYLFAKAKSRAANPREARLMTDHAQTPAGRTGNCWYQLRVIMAGGGDIELTCMRCGHTVTTSRGMEKSRLRIVRNAISRPRVNS